MPPTLGYWNMRGLGHVVRLIHEYLEIEYEDKRYPIGPAPDYSLDSWFSVKFSLGLMFPNLPYYIDGDIKMTQSNAIYRHIGMKHNLLGETENERARCDVMIVVASEIHWELLNMFYLPNWETNRVELAKKVPDKLKGFDEFLGDRKWCAGDTLTIADFKLYDTLDSHCLWPNSKDMVSTFPRLVDFMKRFEQLPRMADFLTRESKTPSITYPQQNFFMKPI